MVADQELARQRVVHRHLRGLVVAHDVARHDRHAFLRRLRRALGEVGDEAAHRRLFLSFARAFAFDLPVDAHEVVARTDRELRVAERERQMRGALMPVQLRRQRRVALLQSLDVRAPAVLAEVAEHVVERAVLHHQHHDVVDAGELAGFEIGPLHLRERAQVVEHEVVDGQRLRVGGQREQAVVAADEQAREPAIDPGLEDDVAARVDAAVHIGDRERDAVNLDEVGQRRGALDLGHDGSGDEAARDGSAFGHRLPLAENLPRVGVGGVDRAAGVGNEERHAPVAVGHRGDARAGP